MARDLVPDIRRCIEVVHAALPRRRKSTFAALTQLSTTLDALERGEAVEVAGLDEALSDLASVGPMPAKHVKAAISALVSFARALDGAEREFWLADAKKWASEAARTRAAKPDLEQIRARLEALSPNDHAAFSELVELASEHRIHELAPLILERLDLDDSTGAPSHAVRVLQRMFRPKVEAFHALCAQHLASPRAGTRRWSAEALAGGVRPEHVPMLVPLLVDAESKVRKAAATTLRAACAWHPQIKDTVRDATAAALRSYPNDRALGELAQAAGAR